MPLTYGALCALAEKHNVTITENMRAFVRAVEEEDLRAQADARPVAYQYLYTWCDGSDVWRSDAGNWNGQNPKASRPLFDGAFLLAAAKAIHFPECWDTAAYPTLADALSAVYEHFRCTNEDTHPGASAPGLSDQDTLSVAAALESARVFIKNGVALGYIRMPDADCPDPAHGTLPLIEHAMRILTRASAATVAEPHCGKCNLPADPACSCYKSLKAAQQQAEPGADEGDDCPELPTPFISVWAGSDAEDCRLDVCYTPSAPRRDGAYATRLYTAEQMRAYARAAQAGQRAGVAARVYPDELSDALRHVLGFPNFHCSPFAHVMRDAGMEIKRKAEDEQATVLHWLVKKVLDHGDKWAEVAAAEFKIMQEKIAAAPAQQQEGAR